MVIRNNAALFAQGVMVAWLALLAVFTWLVGRDGAPQGLSGTLTAALLAFFWLGGLAGAAWAFNRPRVSLEVAADGSLRLDNTHRLRRRREVIAPGSLAAIDLVQTTDSDGDPYFTCWLRLRDGRSFAVAEGHGRQALEGDARRLRAAMGLA